MDQCSAAINNVRMKANSIRTTITQYLEPQLLYNPDPNWQDLLSSIDVVARRLSDMSANDVEPVLNFLAYQPKKPTANVSDIPLFLGTRPLAEMSSADLQFIRELKKARRAEAEEKQQRKKQKKEHQEEEEEEEEEDDEEEESVAELEAKVGLYNSSLQDIEKGYQAAGRALLASFTSGGVGGGGQIHPGKRL